jgi:tRNA(Arg) A34 adenosine deaminase TadA
LPEIGAELASFTDEDYLHMAINLALKARQHGADPFGAVLVNGAGEVTPAPDRSLELSDPTFHAELSVISDYCRKHRCISLDGFTLYSSAEPCPMCAGAIHWARISRVVFSVSQEMIRTLKIARRYSTLFQEKIQPGIEDIINYGNRHVEIIGPLLVKEGLAVFDGYEFIPKIIRHQTWLNTHAKQEK